MTDPRTFRRALAALGVVPAATGLAAIARGTSVVRGGPASVESEHAFFAVWWTALGPLLWAVSRDGEDRTAEVRALAATLFAGGVVRLTTARRAGRPHALYQALAAVELALPVVLVAWQRAVRRESA